MDQGCAIHARSFKGKTFTILQFSTKSLGTFYGHFTHKEISTIQGISSSSCEEWWSSLFLISHWTAPLPLTWSRTWAPGSLEVNIHLCCQETNTQTPKHVMTPCPLTISPTISRLLCLTTSFDKTTVVTWPVLWIETTAIRQGGTPNLCSCQWHRGHQDVITFQNHPTMYRKNSFRTVLIFQGTNHPTFQKALEGQSSCVEPESYNYNQKIFWNTNLFIVAKKITTIQKEFNGTLLRFFKSCYSFHLQAILQVVQWETPKVIAQGLNLHFSESHVTSVCHSALYQARKLNSSGVDCHLPVKHNVHGRAAKSGKAFLAAPSSNYLGTVTKNTPKSIKNGLNQVNIK